MKGRRYIFTPYKNLLQTRFSRLHKISDRLIILVNGGDMIPASLVYKTHKLRKRLKWIYLKDDSQENLHYHWMYLLGKSDAKAADDIEFVLLSNNQQLDSIVKRLNEGGRKCIRIPLSEKKKEEVLDEEPPNAPVANQVKDIRPQPKPPRESAIQISDNESLKASARATVEKLQSTGQRPENLETLKHYIHLFSTSPGNRRVSIDQILDFMEAQQQISIHQGMVTYNF